MMGNISSLLGSRNTGGTSSPGGWQWGQGGQGVGTGGTGQGSMSQYTDMDKFMAFLQALQAGTLAQELVGTGAWGTAMDAIGPQIDPRWAPISMWLSTGEFPPGYKPTMPTGQGEGQGGQGGSGQGGQGNQGGGHGGGGQGQWGNWGQGNQNQNTSTGSTQTKQRTQYQPPYQGYGYGNQGQAQNLGILSQLLARQAFSPQPMSGYPNQNPLRFLPVQRSRFITPYI